MTTDILLIGGGVASVAAAAELRKHGFDGRVILAGRELLAPYRRPPVTKDLLLGATDAAQLAIRADDWWQRKGIELRTRTSVLALDTEAKVAKLAGGEQLEYGSALLATGAMVRRLSADGAQLAGIHYLRAPGNAIALRAELDAADRVVIVGGSFIATEVAGALTTLGKRCTLVMQERQPLELALGGVVARHVGERLQARGIELLGGESVVAFEGEDRVGAVRTASGRSIPADVVVVGVGAVPDVMLARKSGLALGPTGGVRCDERLRTSAPGVFAAGDMCEYDSVIHGRALRVEHEDHAIAQGRTAARNMLGADVAHAEVPWFWTEIADTLRLESVGPPAGWDTELLAGSPADGAFSVFYVSGSTLVGAATIGRPADLAAARELIARGAEAAELAAFGIETARC